MLAIFDEVVAEIYMRLAGVSFGVKLAVSVSLAFACYYRARISKVGPLH